MKRYSRTLRYAPLARGIGGLLVALVCAVALFGCEGDKNTTNTTNVYPPPPPTEGPLNTVAPRALYRDGQGNLVPLDSSSLQGGQFVFYAWLLDVPDEGILTTKLTSSIVSDPGQALVSEQTETAPSFTQDLAGAWVGFMDPTGVVRPVIGADVRWEIDQQWSGMVGSTQFGTSDDNRTALGFGVFDDQADTRTNNSRVANERFPLIATQFPLFNQTGIGTPFADGFTWVTLFSPDKKASARIVAVATINGEEIGKQILYKNFSPAPKIEITKTVNSDVVTLVSGSATVTWTVTVKNTGSGDATNVDLVDTLTTTNGATYTLVTHPGTLVGDGFTDSFSLAALGTPAPPQTAQLLGNAQSFAVLGSQSVSNTGPSVVSGDVGVSAGSSVTGFSDTGGPGLVVNGTIHNNDAVAQAAQTALTAAYVDLGARTCTKPVNTAITGVLTPGVYCYDSSVTTGTAVTLDAQGDPNAEFVFKIGSTLDTPAGTTITLINGASPCNVYWQLGSSATLGANTFFVGNILAQASITAITGTTANISGRLLARAGAVSLDTIAINAPLSCVAAPVSTLPLTFTANVTAAGTYCNQAQITSVTGDNGTTSPVDLKQQACFTAIESNVTLVKDFVADDNTTSLGNSLTVAANVPAKLRVRVFNSGGAAATGVQVNDTITSGQTGTAYQLISLSSGTVNGTGDGFDTAIGGLASGATTTLFFTVAASADGTYCDTASVTVSGGTLGSPSSGIACLTVETPILTITKADAPASVLPGASYTSTIGVGNSGNATARDVVISDLLGLNSDANIQAIYVSSSLNGAGGTLANNVVTANAVDLASGETATFTVVSQIPFSAATGTYCDTASVKSSNAATPPSETACVHVPAFSALQTQLVDLQDPVAVGSDETYFSALYVEQLSNEGVKNNELTYSFGLTSPTGIGSAGVFRVVSTKVYLDTKPVRDPNTGLVLSDPSSATAVLQTEGTDYTVDNSTPGLQVLTMKPASTVLLPDTALYVVHVVNIPTGTTANHLYTTSYIWDSVGVGSGNTLQASSSEPTTVLP